MQKQPSNNVLTPALFVFVLTGFDFLINTFQIQFDENTAWLLIILFPSSIAILVCTLRIWKTILTEESIEKAENKKLLLIVTTILIIAGLSCCLIYLMEFLLSSGLLGLSYYDILLTSNLNDSKIIFLMMVLTFLLKFLLNISALAGCIIVSITWAKQFRTWTQFSSVPFIRSFYFVGISMIILFIDQIITIIVVFVNYWFNSETPMSDYPVELEILLMILFLVATFILPVYIYFLARAGQQLRIPYEMEEPTSRIYIALPMIFFLFWFYANFLMLGGGPILEPWIASFIHAFLFLVIFIPISLNLFRWARVVKSKYLEKNLYLAAASTFALSTYGVVGGGQWFGMNMLPGYLLAITILIWSFANISRYLGARETLSYRLKKAGAQFLSELGEAEMKAQLVQQYSKVLVNVTNNFMEDIAKLNTRVPPTESEVNSYIIRTMGLETTPSEPQIIDYLQGAIKYWKVLEKDESRMR